MSKRPTLGVAERFDLVTDQAGRLPGRRVVRVGLDTNLHITVGEDIASATWKRPDSEDSQAFSSTFGHSSPKASRLP